MEITPTNFVVILGIKCVTNGINKRLRQIYVPHYYMCTCRFELPHGNQKTKSLDPLEAEAPKAYKAFHILP
jgi:hypothetical protein